MEELDSKKQLWSRYVGLEVEEEKIEIQAALEQLSAKELEAREKAALNLVIEHIKFGWFGKLLITFRVAGSTNQDISYFRPGSILGIYRHSKAYDLPISAHNAQITTGVVHHSTGEKVKLSLEESQYQTLSCEVGPELNCRRFSLALTGSDVTFKRRKKLLNSISNIVEYSKDPVQDALFSLLLGNSEPVRKVASEELIEKIQLLVKSLNETQREAILMALTIDPCFCIHGPPGTGKTTTVVALIQCLVSLGFKVLATAPSNIAVDNIMERCEKLRMVRLGHPSRVSSLLHRNIFEKKAARSNAYQLCAEIKTELADALKIQREGVLKGSKDVVKRLDQDAAKLNRKSIRAAAHREVHTLHKELRTREKQVALEVFENSDVVFCTCVGSDHEGLNQYIQAHSLFDFVIIDEAGQATEIDSWIPLLKGKRLILAGDPQQLSATIKSKVGLRENLGQSLLDKVMAMHGPAVSHLLTLQYRMHQRIMQWSSDRFYDSLLKAADNCKDRSFSNMPAIHWIDTGDSAEECMLEDARENEEIVKVTSADGEQRTLDTSKSNIAEALVCLRFLESLDASILEMSSLGVITPYKDQVVTLRMLFEDFGSDSDRLKISTVDGFQGQERDIIVISLVRSNPENAVGFLDDCRRLNVATTRAKRLLVIIGASQCVSAASETFASLFDYVQLHGEVSSSSAFCSTIEIEDVRARYKRPHCITKKTFAASSGTRKKSDQKPPAVGKRGSNEIELQKRDGSQRKDFPTSARVKHMSETNERNSWTVEHRKLLASLTESSRPLRMEGLTSFQRMRIHEMAESLRLLHVTHTDSNGNRVLTLRHPNSSRVQLDLSDSEPADRCLSQEGAISVNCLSQKGSSSADCQSEKESSCVACQSEKEPILTKKSINDTSKASLHSKQPKSEIQPQRSRNDPSRSKLCEDPRKLDDDTFLEMMIAKAEEREGKCFVHDCPKLVNLLGQICRHCNRKYCYEHGLPEIHGCGAAARQWARQEKPSKRLGCGIQTHAIRGRSKTTCHGSTLPPKEDTGAAGEADF
eukprot:Gregarina_sp_Poly_1__1610@NODE_1408_length_4208_cov_111_912340_g938_i0_p1_GENE_NODE_1408_length_4208_cov_111_912340_g938_i0NODE_1408_length_4208_cov_111_912340_g938_i0_p1_ORF_typecomplete_len1039_score151_62AAA_12/PF13087_6/1_3e52AAA_11/PF13086_6/1_5e51AAA_11/PF13086_6/2_2e03AAA_30/PF13604_6/5_9e24Viral_helicase1/PF01443_18/3_1e14AAA_19/PF13245_6/3e14AAA_19/PF13245_6/1_6e03ResIII/PF04851_15/1_6e08PIF1/PF05970_14/1_4e05PIF1/PF05970_14/70zfAN1/PF01428_16/4_3e06UvrDhelicase/PF00580_21/8e06PhoH/PF02